MLNHTVYLTGTAKFGGMQEPKRPKCTLTAVRCTLTALKGIPISWCEPPLWLIYDTLKTAVDNKIEPHILLSHKIIWEKVKRLLLCHLQPDFRPLIKLLRQKTISYQLSILWMHIPYFHTTPDALKLLLTSEAYYACWVCNRLHFPLGRATTHLQAKWKAIRAGEYFNFQIPHHLKKLWLQPMKKIRGNNFVNLQNKSIQTLNIYFKTQIFFTKFLFLCAETLLILISRIWDCMNATSLHWQLTTFFISISMTTILSTL